MGDKKRVSPHLGNVFVGQVVCISLSNSLIHQVRTNKFIQQYIMLVALYPIREVVFPFD